MLKIIGIKINGIGPIKNLELKFDDHFNIICGQNGIGKTTILDCLAQSFAVKNTSVKKNANSERGSWVIEAFIAGLPRTKYFGNLPFHPNESDFSSNEVGFFHQSNDVIVFKTHRDIPYKHLSALETDPQKKDQTFASETLKGSLPDDLKNWFVNRYLFSAQPNSLDENQMKNHQLAKGCFSFLNPQIIFSRVLPGSFDILLNTPMGEIYFEYLSSGYKSCLAVLLGLIREVELRYKDPSKYIREFEGVVFIDEIDLHLHPEWQAKTYNSLKTLLPKAQIFTSTHSPHIIQVAKPNEIIALTQDEDNDIKLNPVINEEFGCQGWTVEEILTDVMGMTETRTDLYLDTMNSFNVAIENEDFEAAQKTFEIIDRMLHPENSLKKILKIQLTGISEND